MKIIFLDIDGVLNYHSCFDNLTENSDVVTPEHNIAWNKRCVRELNRILDKTDAKIVVSSTWRSLNYLYSMIVNDMGIKEGSIIGRTPDRLPITMYGGTCRGDEIKAWLVNTDIITENIVILDDDDDMGDLMGYLVQTDWFGDGLNRSIADKAITILDKGD